MFKKCIGIIYPTCMSGAMRGLLCTLKATSASAPMLARWSAPLRVLACTRRIQSMGSGTSTYSGPGVHATGQQGLAPTSPSRHAQRLISTSTKLLSKRCSVSTGNTTKETIPELGFASSLWPAFAGRSGLFRLLARVPFLQGMWFPWISRISGPEPRFFRDRAQILKIGLAFAKTRVGIPG